MGLVPEDISKQLAQQLFSSLEYLHKKQVIHRDIKLENILVQHDKYNKGISIRLIDFGFAEKIP